VFFQQRINFLKTNWFHSSSGVQLLKPMLQIDSTKARLQPANETFDVLPFCAELPVESCGQMSTPQHQIRS
jgi:hypothetical protein